MNGNNRIIILILYVCALVSINWGDSMNTSLENHHRSKRATPSSTTNVSFIIEKTNGWENVTSIKVAQKASFKVTGWIPVASIDLFLEISAPVETDGAVMALCTPRITSVGSNLGFQPKDKRVVTESTTKDSVHDHAYIDFGTVSNSNVGDSTTDNYQIVIEFEVIMLNYSKLTFVTKPYWVSAGASYKNKEKLWVGQGSFTAVNDTLTSSQLPTMDLIGPSSVIPGTTAVWKVVMVLKDAVNAILADVYMPFNASGVMSLCRINVGDKGEGFACYDKEAYPNTTYTKNKQYTDLVSMGTINLGKVYNTAYWNSTSSDLEKTFTLEIAASILNNSDLQSADPDNLWVGVAVEFDQVTIWSAQKKFNVSSADVGLPTSPAQTPDFSITSSNTKIPINGYTAIQINMTLPMSTSERYVMELELPSNGSSPLEACDFRVRYKGFNYPCLKTPNVSYVSKNNDSINDYVRVDFGIITNTGLRSDNDANRLSVEVVVRLRSDVGLSDGDDIKVVAGVMYGSKAIWVGCANVSYGASVTQPNKSPEFRLVNVMNKRDNLTIYQGGQTAFYAEMKLPINTYYPSIQLVVSAPYDNTTTPYTARLYFCSVRVKDMGANLPCNKESKVATLTATLNPTKEKLPNMAALNLTHISNVGFHDFGDKDWGTYNDSVIRFEAVVGVIDDSRMVEGQTYYFSFGIQYWSSTIWVGKIGVTYTANTTDLESTDVGPLSGFERASKNFSAQAGAGVEYHANVWLSPRTISTYAVEAIIPSNHTLTVCRIAVKKRGSHIPCPYPKRTAQYFAYGQPSNQYDRAYYDIGTVADIGQRIRTSENKEEDLMQVSVVVGLHPLANLVEGENHTFSLAVSMGKKQIMLASGVVSVDTGKSTLGSISPTTYLVLNSKSTDIVIGGSKTLFVDIYVPPNSMASYNIEAYAPSNITHLGKMAACDLHLTSAAWNLPCVNDSLTNVTYPEDSKNQTFTRAVMAVGYIYNMGDGGAIEHNNNLLRAEFTVTALVDAGLIPGDIVYVGATVDVDNTQLWVGQTNLTVVKDVFQDGEILTTISHVVKAPDTPTGALQRIGQIGTWKAIIKMPAMTGWVKINVTTPYVNGEALATVVRIRPLNTRNVPCAERSKPKITKTSAVSNNQPTFHELAFVVTHTGATYRHQWLPGKPEDDLVVEIDLQVTDHINNNNGSAINFQVGVILTDNTDTVWSTTQSTVYAWRDGTERPELQQSLSILPTSPTLPNPKDNMLIFVHFNHTTNSTAHAFKVQARLSFPPLAGRPVITNWTHLQPTTTDFVNGSFSMIYDKVFFVDNVTTLLSVQLDPNARIPIGEGQMVVNVVLEISYFDGDRANWPTAKNEFTTKVSSVKQNFFVPECFEAISIDSLQSCQVTWEPTNRPYSIQANAKWPRDVSFQSVQALQFSLGNRTRVTALELRLLATLPADLPLSISLSSSDDGRRWNDHVVKGSTTIKTYSVSISASASSGTTIRVNITEETVVGRYVKVKFTITDTTTIKRFPADKVTLDLVGCYISRDADQNSVCKATPPIDIYERGLLVTPAENALYVCIITDTKNQASCSVTRDIGETWTAIDEEIVNINYYVKSSKKLLGLANNRRTRMCSLDGGQNWFSIPQTQYDMDISDINNILGVQAFQFDGTYAVVPGTPFTNSMLEINSTVKVGMDRNGVHVFSSSAWTLVSYWENKT